ncbi:MAG TPA: hydroxymethylbilane synthase [Actinomycetota bacterium]|nr:hydroxymethylbilane synthase [Actinomycetota bacterium]
MATDLSCVTIASRGSGLALRQTGLVGDLLRAAHPSLDVVVETVSTTGDRDARPFAQIGTKGLFVAEVERALLDGRADVAVHSAKDLTARLADGCTIVCVPARAAVYDVVIGGRGDSGEERLARLPPGARVGTSSIRRRALLAEIAPHVDVVDLRGNLDTRVRKAADGDVDAAVLAAAGLERLYGDGGPDRAPLDPARWVPAPAQGALAVEALAARADVRELFDGLSDERARAEVECERAFSERLEGGCSVPVGCTARVDGASLVATGYLGHPGGGDPLRDRVSGGVREAAALGRELADAILDAGGVDILAELSADDAPPVDAP